MDRSCVMMKAQRRMLLLVPSLFEVPMSMCKGKVGSWQVRGK